MHWVDDNFIRHDRLLAAIPLKATEHTAAAIAGKLDDLFDECSIQKETVVCLVRDAASTMVAASRIAELDS